MTQKISVIILTKNEERNIETCINSINNQNYNKKLEIILVDKSTDSTPKIARNKGAKVVEDSGNGFADARNLGIKFSDGEIIFFISADSYLVENDTLQVIEKELNNYYGVGGKLLFPDNVLGYYYSRPFKSRPKVIKSFNEFSIPLATVCFAMRREVFDEYGLYFDSDLNMGCEDLDIFYNLLNNGLTIKYNPHIKVFHDTNMDINHQLKKAKREGQALNRFCEKYDIITEFGTKKFREKYDINTEFGTKKYLLLTLLSSAYATLDTVRKKGIGGFKVFKYNYLLRRAREKGFLEAKHEKFDQT